MLYPPFNGPLTAKALDHYLEPIEFLEDASGARFWLLTQFENLCLTGFSDLPRWLIQNPSNGVWSSYVPTRNLVKALLSRSYYPPVRRVIQALLLEMMEPTDESVVTVTSDSLDPDWSFAQSMLPDTPTHGGLDPLTRILLDLDPMGFDLN